jgi:DNA-binding MarR family transcriptional regulator
MAKLAEVSRVLNGFADVMARLMIDHHQQQIAMLDLTLPQAQVLRVLRRGNTTPGQLATELKMSASSVTQLTDRLIRKALIERQEVKGDRRSVHIALSGKGKRMVDQFRKRRSVLFTEAIARLTETEQAQVIAALEMVITAFDSYERETNK